MPMSDGYYPRNSESPDDVLDELLCEYVDGTMDPDVKRVFEEYLATDPRLAAHARQLCETRNMLCTVGACKCASAGMQAQLRLRLAGELARKNRSSLLISNRLGNMALLTSAVGMLLLVGMMAGLLTAVQRSVDDRGQQLEMASASNEELTPRQMHMSDDAHGAQQRGYRLDKLEDVERSAVHGPVNALPVVTGGGQMTPARLQQAAAGD